MAKGVGVNDDVCVVGQRYAPRVLWCVIRSSPVTGLNPLLMLPTELGNAGL